MDQICALPVFQALWGTRKHGAWEESKTGKRCGFRETRWPAVPGPPFPLLLLLAPSYVFALLELVTMLWAAHVPRPDVDGSRRSFFWPRPTKNSRFFKPRTQWTGPHLADSSVSWPGSCFPTPGQVTGCCCCCASQALDFSACEQSSGRDIHAVPILDHRTQERHADMRNVLFEWLWDGGSFVMRQWITKARNK